MRELCSSACCYAYERRPKVSDLGFVISLTVQGPADIEAAKIIARRLVRSLESQSILPGLEIESTTVAFEGNPFKAFWPICGYRLAQEKRCLRPGDHRGQHSPLWVNE